MTEKDYIYHQAIISCCIINLVALLFIGFGAVTSYMIWKKDLYLNDVERRRNMLLGAIAAIVLGMAISVSSLSELNREKRIRDNFAETVGITIQTNQRTKAGWFRYRFTANKHYYYGCSYGGGQLIDVKCPNGKYKVAYNSKNPNESVMDFDYGSVND